ncbi:hypothetical protein ELH48_15980 [Rhizobium ruizarguesonis]|jgi:hypothetical protein|uniref:hypothetical protein n=1 Tax=Rhizobium ruizarguesonis TaxID=2081791 RepID=UPI00048457A7|nr:hypothetical protein [Rhizobium ruizarguesonis]MBY5829370.1 hypothetical protein [Rhizobium leguminosarum]QJS28630.1 hypothetical protein RLTA1_15535 [Rhizobium leguminosarum bv. trifolii TA1]MBY5858035.1 hypothetical protein [Rhizobium leguminosarum]MBY5870818.1 hypothetical protein [Rhizobium leguminosarum]NEH67523.1 hypothetical protein [Rhizobium ruizarguesonis]
MTFATVASSLLIALQAIPLEVWGVLIGGLITMATTAYFAGREHRKKRKSEAVAVALKATLINNSFSHLLHHIKSADNKAKGTNPRVKFDLWTRIPLLSGKLEPIVIEPNELLVFIEAREYELVQDLLTLTMRHKSMCDAFNDFADRKIELRSRVTEGTILSGEIVSHNAPLDMTSQIIVMELNTLTNSITDLLPLFRQESATLCKKLTPALRKHLGDKSVPYFREVG